MVVVVKDLVLVGGFRVCVVVVFLLVVSGM